MKKVVVLNPLIEKLLNNQDYRFLLDELEYWRFLVTDPTPGIAEVRERYRQYIKETLQSPVIDSRCPYIVNMICEEFPHLEGLLAPIDPILITGAEMRRKEFGEKDTELYIVAPCKGFEKYTTSNRLVYTWQDFKGQVIHFYPLQKLPESSPVPLGFFNELEAKVYSASGKENCQKLLANYSKDAELLELLFCDGGCHKGDGL